MTKVVSVENWEQTKHQEKSSRNSGELLGLVTVLVIRQDQFGMIAGCLFLFALKNE